MSRFGTSHWIAGALVVLAVACVTVIARRNTESARWLCRATAVVLLLAEFGSIAVDALEGEPWRYFMPLHLCDLVVFVGAFALWTRKQLAFELTYFWGLVGASLAMIAPELNHEFPHLRFIFYFVQHGAIVLAAMLLSVGVGMRPRRWSPVKAWLFLHVYAGVLAIINGLCGTNFMFLRAPPPGPSPLDWFGAWPWYLLVSELLALLVFVFLYLPFRQRTSRAPAP